MRTNLQATYQPSSTLELFQHNHSLTHPPITHAAPTSPASVQNSGPHRRSDPPGQCSSRDVLSPKPLHLHLHLILDSTGLDWTRPVLPPEDAENVHSNVLQHQPPDHTTQRSADAASITLTLDAAIPHDGVTVRSHPISLLCGP